jgi:hypothetical protein
LLESKAIAFPVGELVGAAPVETKDMPPFPPPPLPLFRAFKILTSNWRSVSLVCGVDIEYFSLICFPKF